MASERSAAAARRKRRAQGKQALWLKWRGNGPPRLFAFLLLAVRFFSPLGAPLHSACARCKITLWFAYEKRSYGSHSPHPTSPPSEGANPHPVSPVWVFHVPPDASPPSLGPSPQRHRLLSRALRAVQSAFLQVPPAISRRQIREAAEENEMDLSSWLMVLVSMCFLLIVVVLFLKKGPELTAEEQEAQKAERARLEAGAEQGKKNAGDA
jgi:hypothetical protein